MVHRATDYETAQEVSVAVELARCGASAALIERVTGFGARWVRGAVRENGGALARKPRDPVRWFEADPQRLLHAYYVVMAYDLQPANSSAGRRLVDTYRAYRTVIAESEVLEINECAQMVELYQSNGARVRPCSGCRMRYLVVSERSLCPVCRLIAREFCKGCQQPLETQRSHSRAYCVSCSPRSARLANRMRNSAHRHFVSLNPSPTAGHYRGEAHPGSDP